MVNSRVENSAEVSFDWSSLALTPNFFKTSYNKINFELALALSEVAINKSPKVNLKQIFPPMGRFDVFEHHGKMVVVDYAHTPDALEKIALEIKSSFPDKLLSYSNSEPTIPSWG